VTATPVAAFIQETKQYATSRHGEERLVVAHQEVSRLGGVLAMSSRLAARQTPYHRGSETGTAIRIQDKDTTMAELLVDFITSLDGYASGEGWPGFWGLEGPEYLSWLGEQPEVTYVMGANTYRLMSGFAAGQTPAGTDAFTADEEASVDGLTRASKVVFSASLEEPLTWANSTVVRDDAVEAVRAMKQGGSGPMSTIGSLSLCRSLLLAGLVDRFRVVMFPVITGATGAERIYDGYPDVALEMIDNRTFDGRIQLVEYRPRILEHPPLGRTA
jgi:dihydrofolate reductase